MNEVSASRAEASGTPIRQQRVLIWDAPVRVFHWLMVLSFAGAWLTAESERWRMLHVTLGYTMAGLVMFRIVWGFVGTSHARFSDFVRGPRAVARYVAAMLHRRPAHHVGHNPVGALAIVALLGLTLAIALSGWALFNDVGGDWLEQSHELAADTMMAVAAIHLAGVLLASRWEHQNLVASMLTGYKAGRPEDAVRGACSSVALLMLAAVLGFWWLQWLASR